MCKTLDQVLHLVEGWKPNIKEQILMIHIYALKSKQRDRIQVRRVTVAHSGVVLMRGYNDSWPIRKSKRKKENSSIKEERAF